MRRFQFASIEDHDGKFEVVESDANTPEFHIVAVKDNKAENPKGVKENNWWISCIRVYPLQNLEDAHSWCKERNLTIV